MRILLTNDDGVYFPGLHALHKAARALGSVSVVAPISEQSGAAHSISILQPLRVSDVYLDGQFFGRGVNGAPADCVRLAVKELLDEPPDVLLSGINLGANTGFCVFYSGTVAAAIEGGLLGIPSMAVSLQSSTQGGTRAPTAGGSDAPDFDLAAYVAVRLLDVLAEANANASGSPVVLNVNIPALPRSKLKGIRITHQGRTGVEEGFVRRKDPRGRDYYWIDEERGGGAAAGPGEQDKIGTGNTPISGACPHFASEDMQALQEGYVSVTPLQCDLTNRGLCQHLHERKWKLF